MKKTGKDNIENTFLNAFYLGKIVFMLRLGWVGGGRKRSSFRAILVSPTYWQHTLPKNGWLTNLLGAY